MYSALLMGAMGLNATAQQQLPNSGFQEAWVTCNPWANGNTTNVGTTPTDWCVSNVGGYKVIASWMGTTVIAKNVEGYESTSAVELNSTQLKILTITKNIPAYITLGTTWNTANTSGGNADGGSFGGYKFSDRPAGLQFMYKRSDSNTEKTPSSVIAYLWKGTYTQADVPVTIASKPTKVTMTNRDRNILEMTTNYGGDVDRSEGAELIAVINTSIADEATEWTKFSTKFDYKSDATPEMINVILAAGDYFADAADVKPNISLTIDNVRVFYEYSGYLNINMDPFGAIATDQDATIQITPTGDGKCTFSLPNFSVESLGLELGDIVVDNVSISEKDGENYYEGSVDGLKLPEGAADNECIVANVSLSGTTDDMKIAVNWVMDPAYPSEVTPIEVSFTKNPLNGDTNGITDITVDNSNAPVEFYNLQGVRVNAGNLIPGIYVRRQGSQVSKVLVK